MVSRLLLLITFLAVALIGDGVVRGAPVENKEDDCNAKAYKIYDYFTSQGCPSDYPPAICEKALVEAVVALNIALAICKPPEGYTLCRVQKPGFFSFVNCASVNQFDAIPKERCEAESKKDFTFHGNDGSQQTFSSSEAFCVETPNFDCSKLC
ncbi:hypothetical protein [Parasitella parasitica]|uniref:Uncharacterized protein n=1 Tax=Parasitella parasitica TaxID=35722 RepID=A0A0B7MUP6_9FUNG|nr:hypothetical protein [Parasitella parasitica]